MVTFAEVNTAGAHNEDIVAVLLICLVISMVITAIIIRRLIRAEQRRRSEPLSVAPVTSAVSYLEAPSRWLAIRVQNTDLVRATLGVQNVRVCSWSDALSTPSEPRLFISPPVRGWVLVSGCDLPDPSDDVDACFVFLTRLSHQLGEVQFFTRNRAVSHHGWVKAEDGKIVRAYVWAGETLWNQGSATEAERDLKLRCLTYTESADVLGLAEGELLSMNTDKVIRLASQWSLDPTAIEAELLECKGIAGDLLHSKFH